MQARSSLAGKSHLLLRWAVRSRTSSTTTTNQFSTSSKILEGNPIHLRRFSPPSVHGFKVFSRQDIGLKNSSLFSLRASSGGGGGSGGKTGGWLGGSGNGGYDAGGAGIGGGSGGSNWSLLSWYMSILAKYLVMTKAVTSAFLTLVGDLICQLVFDQVPSIDLKRTSIFTLLGLILVGPTLHFCFFFAPAFIGVFLSTLVTLEGRAYDVIPKLQQEWLSSVVANWQLWIPFQLLNFRFVPQQFQVLATNLIALVWNVILSYKAHKQVVPN